MTGARGRVNRVKRGCARQSRRSLERFTAESDSRVPVAVSDGGMSTLALVNIGAIATGILARPTIEAEALLVSDGRIVAIGSIQDTQPREADVVVDCRGTTVIPGLIDSHCHVVLGDYTPRQKQVDFLDSYVHGGITSVVSAGEGVHAPGRPHNAAIAKALAIAATGCFANFRPNGMKVNAGSVILEPGLTDADFAEMAKLGVRHA